MEHLDAGVAAALLDEQAERARNARATATPEQWMRAVGADAGAGVDAGAGLVTPPDPAARPGRLGVGVVGTGRVGAVLGSALRAAGHPVVAVSAISEASRERAAALLPGVPVLDIPEVVRRAELVLLTVPDDALPGLVRGLADVGAWQVGPDRRAHVGAVRRRRARRPRGRPA